MKAKRICPHCGETVDVEMTPTEVKTTRVKELYIPSNVPDHFVAQLGMYVAMLKPEEQAGRGELILFYLGVKGRHGISWRNLPALKSFTLDYDDLPGIRGMMVKRKALLDSGEMPSTETCHSWLCRFCKWYKAECYGWGSDVGARVDNTLKGKWYASH